MSDYKTRIVVKYNKNLNMTPGKVAAQAVHAALTLFGVHPGEDTAVIVLSANKGPVEAMEAVIRDHGVTEVKPGSTTAGASFDFPVKDNDSPERQRLNLAYATYLKASKELAVAREAHAKTLWVVK